MTDGAERRQIAFLKSYSTKCAQETARDAVHVFGGRGITKTGMGRTVEHYYRTVPFDALLGGGGYIVARYLTVFS